MVFKNKQIAGFRITLIVVLMAAMYGVLPIGASAQASDELLPAKNDCQPDSGWMWTAGPSEPDIAAQAQAELAEEGIYGSVEARGYGETDSCGKYVPHDMDFSIRLADKQVSSQEGVNDAILSTLNKHGKPSLGNVKLISSDGSLISNNINKDSSLSKEMVVDALPAQALAGDPITKNVYVIVYDPLLTNGQSLSQRLGWNSHATITQQTVDFFKQTTNNKMNYTIVQTTVVTSGWPFRTRTLA